MIGINFKSIKIYIVIGHGHNTKWLEGQIYFVQMIAQNKSVVLLEVGLSSLMIMCHIWIQIEETDIQMQYSKEITLQR